MGLLSGLLGNASEVSADAVAQEVGPILIPQEKVEKCFKLIRDIFVFTDKRLILIDKQGITGKKIEYHSIPYKSITHFAVETAGHFDLDAELKIWVSGNSVPIEKTFTKGVHILDVQKLLASIILNPQHSAVPVVPAFVHQPQAPVWAVPVSTQSPQVTNPPPFNNHHFPGDRMVDQWLNEPNPAPQVPQNAELPASQLLAQAQKQLAVGQRVNAINTLKEIARLYPQTQAGEKALRALQKANAL
jgi:hypothetical protein